MLIAPITEPCPIFDVFTDGIARVDVFGGSVRISYFSFQVDVAHPEAAAGRVVCAKMVWSLDRLMSHGGQVSKFIQSGRSGEWPGLKLVR